MKKKIDKKAKISSKFPLLKLKPKIKKIWLTSLRSGDYKQGTSFLRYKSVDSDDLLYCCLGVLCDLHRKMTKQKGWSLNVGTVFRYGIKDDISLPPMKVLKWAFTSESIEEVQPYTDPISIRKIPVSKTSKLTFLNDSGKSFKQIANIIEKKL